MMKMAEISASLEIDREVTIVSIYNNLIMMFWR